MLDKPLKVYLLINAVLFLGLEMKIIFLKDIGNFQKVFYLHKSQKGDLRPNMQFH